MQFIVNKKVLCSAEKGSVIWAKPNTVRPRDTRPQAARTSTVHDFELGPKKLEKHVF